MGFMSQSPHTLEDRCTVVDFFALSAISFASSGMDLLCFSLLQYMLLKLEKDKEAGPGLPTRSSSLGSRDSRR